MSTPALTHPLAASPPRKSGQRQERQAHGQGHGGQQEAQAQTGGDPARDEDLRQQRQRLDGEIQRAADADALGGVGKRVGHQPRLLHVQKRIERGQQHDQQGNAQQVARAENARNAG
ncbi:hypothetical protein G6F57_020721 [Rhizopus arrhizus]|nr:hypothetical protein G6F57_020721 [Rhizopus arrhizus]